MPTHSDSEQNPDNLKKKYEPPALQVYGDLKSLTQMMIASKGGNRNDGGGLPRTRL